jgi:uncharacterized protein (DUF4415 family)
MKKPSGKKQLEHLVALPDEAIDLSDIPETLDWAQAQVGRFYRPIKQSVTMRLDADVLEWFKENSGKYQSRMNQVLREFMLSQRSDPSDPGPQGAALGSRSPKGAGVGSRKASGQH